IEMMPVAPASNVASGTGVIYYQVTPSLSGRSLSYAAASVITAGTTNATTIAIKRILGGVPNDVLKSALSLASGTTASGTGSINGSNSDLLTGDLLRVDVTGVSSTPPQGLLIAIEAS